MGPNGSIFGLIQLSLNPITKNLKSSRANGSVLGLRKGPRSSDLDFLDLGLCKAKAFVDWSRAMYNCYQQPLIEVPLFVLLLGLYIGPCHSKPNPAH